MFANTFFKACGLWTGKGFHSAKLCVQQSLGFYGLIRMTAKYSRVVLKVRGTKTRFLTGSLWDWIVQEILNFHKEDAILLRANIQSRSPLKYLLWIRYNEKMLESRYCTCWLNTRDGYCHHLALNSARHRLKVIVGDDWWTHMLNVDYSPDSESGEIVPEE